MINTMGPISATGTAYPSRAPDFIPVFCEVPVAQSLILRNTLITVFRLLTDFVCLYTYEF